MYLLDVNVLVAAHRDDHALYQTARGWFDEVLSGDERFAVPLPVWGSFIRIVTNPRIAVHPTPRTDAFAFVQATVEQPQYATVTGGLRHLMWLRMLCDEGDARGDLVPDAVLAAYAVEHHCEIVTLDRDFARFPSVRHTLLGAD